MSAVVIYGLYVSYFTMVKSYWVERVKMLIYTRVAFYIFSADSLPRSVAVGVS